MYRKFLKNENGATAIEYGLMIALFVIAIVAGLNLFAGASDDLYTNLSNTVVSAGA